MLPPGILLASIVIFLAFGVTASPSNIGLYTFEFQDNAADQGKRKYADDLARWVGKENMDTLRIGDEIVALVGLLSTQTAQKIDRKDIIKNIWLDWTPFRYIQDYQPVSSEHKRSEQSLNSRIISDDGDDNDDNDDDDNDDDRVFKRAPATIIQDTKANNELKFISMAKSEQSMAWKSKSYNYDAKAGTGVTIYIHGNAFNQEHKEFKKPVPGVTRGTIEYLYAQNSTERGYYFSRGPKPDTDPDGSGTCEADKAIGRLNGIAKGANLKFVPKIATREGVAWKVAGLQAIVTDIKNQREHIKRDSASGEMLPPVVNLNYQLDTKGLSPIAVKLYRKYLQALVDLNAVIIISAGDNNVVVDQYPALFASEDALKDNILIVGSVRLNGSKAPSSNHGPLVKISAPADGAFKTIMRFWNMKHGPNGITCASHDNNNKMVYRSGTAFAAPQIAGLAAELISTDPQLRGSGSTARKVVQKILNLAWSRGSQDNPEALWNGLEPGSTGRPSVEQMTFEDGEGNDPPGSCVIQ